MESREELLQEIEELAYCYMKLDEITIITEIQAELMAKPEFMLAFKKGRLKRKAEFNSKLIQLSNQLSSPAMNIESEIAKETYLNDQLL